MLSTVTVTYSILFKDIVTIYYLQVLQLRISICTVTQNIVSIGTIDNSILSTGTVTNCIKSTTSM